MAVLASCIGLIRLGRHRCFDQVVAVEAHHSQNIRHQEGLHSKSPNLELWQVEDVCLGMFAMEGNFSEANS